MTATDPYREMAEATKKVHGCPTVSGGAAGIEKRYAAAYATLVKAGEARRLRRKYRA